MTDTVLEFLKQNLITYLMIITLAGLIRILAMTVTSVAKHRPTSKARSNKLIILLILISMACPASATQQEVELMQVNLRNIWAPMEFQHPPVLSADWPTDRREKGYAMHNYFKNNPELDIICFSETHMLKNQKAAISRWFDKEKIQLTGRHSLPPAGGRAAGISIYKQIDYAD